MRKMSVLAIVIAAFITATYAEKGKTDVLDFEKNPYSSSGPETTIPGNSLPDLTDASEVDDAKSSDLEVSVTDDPLVDLKDTDDAKSKPNPGAWWGRRRSISRRRRRIWGRRRGGRRRRRYYH